MMEKVRVWPLSLCQQISFPQCSVCIYIYIYIFIYIYIYMEDLCNTPFWDRSVKRHFRTHFCHSRNKRTFSDIYDKAIYKWWIGKDFEGRGRGLFMIQSRHLRGGNEGKYRPEESLSQKRFVIKPMEGTYRISPLHHPARSHVKLDLFP
jgi:hypothetical protein